MVEGEAEVGHVGLGALVGEAAAHVVGYVPELLGGWEDEGGEGGDVGSEGLAGGGREVAGEGEAGEAGGVLFLVDALVGAVVGTGLGADEVEEAVLGLSPVFASVGDDHGGAPHSEDAIGYLCN